MWGADNLYNDVSLKSRFGSYRCNQEMISENKFYV